MNTGLRLAIVACLVVSPHIAAADPEPELPAAVVAPPLTPDHLDRARYHPLAAKLTLAGMYTAFAGWMPPTIR